ncbi:MAG: trypsin-like peptidase domain-containing protein [Acidobacteriota bacterium]|nr:trypsin-like peptidase domain-containing protein [Acidobacteriota bacterium]
MFSLLALSVPSFAQSATPAGATAKPAAARHTLLALDDELQSLAARVGSSVVTIEVNGLAPVDDQATHQTTYIAKEQGVGSGVILDASGYIVTNAHVVEHATSVYVLIFRHRDASKREDAERLPARILGRDTLTDLALLKVDATDLPVLPLADSDKVRVGQLALAFGSPLGLENTVTMGVISSTQRQLSDSVPLLYLQTDAAINPGNSGGPLVNVDGQVIGMNSMIVSQSGGSEGMGFSIPANTIRYVYDQLRLYGRVRRGLLGVILRGIDPALASGLGLPQQSGIILEDVTPGGPADRAGLRPGDIVLSVDGKSYSDPRRLTAVLFQRPIGDNVAFRVLRNGKEETHVPAIAERPGDPESVLDPTQSEANIVAKLGVVAIAVDTSVAQLIPPMRLPGGILITALTAGGNGAAFGLRAGDIIHAVNKQPTNTMDALRSALAVLKPGDTAVLSMERGGQLNYIVFRNPD